MHWFNGTIDFLEWMPNCITICHYRRCNNETDAKNVTIVVERG